ncbi:protein STICHEL-like [Cynara cardunculus var. scolymus]|uniref:DNA polymerase III, clamp loader complex, gamma/delta/delta subunit, C-terminal n=1 Tax=Cynara cardunculus var. scolymus TaxID=59895 RepID=A0A118K6X2_CYNCS|nr:protein STICHEL-like [Cynara cardunculus var. scolymus]XP_024965226.1 protein STICHEL-like [Cynara cardunculus var. scolymus]KVI11328.1 DNA polymerase III, clamp loader complex, gamma/delta/delta subunit, C-terminal [Cynara cardunculus var. scolymus]
MSGTRSGSYSGGLVDPSNLHLKKELTQIRKAARALRDPGTTSSWRSPLSSSRSTTAVPAAAASSFITTAPSNHYNHHYRNSGGYSVEEPTENNTKDDANNNNVNGSSNNDNSNRRKEKKVFLYNWRTQRSESERSASVTGQTDDNRRMSRHQQRGNADDGIGDGEESVDDSLSDARNDGDTKSDTYCAAATSSSSKMFNTCKDSNNLATPPVRRASLMKKKPKKMTHSSAALKHQLQRRLSLVDQYDDVNSEDIVVKGSSVTSPLLSRLKSSKLLGGSGSRKDDSSYCYSTPALSTSSFNKYWVRNPSTVGSWDATTGSLNDGDEGVDYHDNDDDQLDLPGRQGCGIPCYWSSSKRSTPKRGGVCGSCYSPSFSDTLRRKGSSILCGSQTMYHRHRGSSVGACNKKRLVHTTSQGLVPLLTNGAESRDRSSVGTDDELSTNYGELDLEALSRLDGRRWSTSYRSQEGLELVAVNGEREGDSPSSLDNINCFSHKYKPMFFEDLVGQNVVVQSLVNAIMRGRIAPIYLFQGTRGTGKTSTARIFAAALNCLATGETRPCGICRECADYITGKSQVITEMDGSNKKGIDKIRYLMKKLQMGPSISTFIQHNVYVIDECHLLPSKLWLAFQKFLEEPPPSVVFIFITTDLDNVPRAVLSRCQKYLFSKIKDSDIVIRLRKIAEEENLDVESGAFDLIALNVEGSLRDAETMLDQLSLLGKRITTNLVNELVGVVSDEKLLELLELAMSSNTAETVKRAREFMDLGVDPMVLMSQMATLIMDIIAGTYQVVEAGYGDSLFDGRSLTEAELERLKHALKLLSEAEKQLRLSSERSTWFTATLLQLGSAPSADPTPSGSSRRQSSRTTDDDPSATFKDIYFQKQRSDSHYSPQKSASKPIYRNSTSPEEVLLPKRQLINGDGPSASNGDVVVGNTIPRHSNSSILDDIWVRCIDKCHSKTLRQLLHTYGNLVSISEDKGTLVAYIVFQNSDIKSRAERFLSSITNSFEIVLCRNIEVRIIFLSDDGTAPNSVLAQKQIDSLQEPIKASGGSFHDAGSKSSGVLAEGDGGTKGRKSGNPVQRIESIIHEQRLETAWLQTAEKGTPGSLNRLKPERNQVLPQDGSDHHQRQMVSNDPSSQQQWEDELTRELNLLKINDGKTLSREHKYPISPSLLHDSNLVGKYNKESMGYESGSGGGGCLCWNKSKHNRRGKIKPGTPVGPRRSARFLLFGECGKSGRTDQRSRR